jgi:three-Cys-motif partner protein
LDLTTGKRILAKVEYDWLNGAPLLDHTSRKLKILREYVSDYIRIRCQIPRQLFRLAIVDGFSGGGRYAGGEPGSPLVFVEEVIRAAREIALLRQSQGFAPLSIQCHIILNDLDPAVAQMAVEQLQPFIALSKEVPTLSLTLESMSLPFEQAYPQIRSKLQTMNFSNVLFNLDQCGHSLVEIGTLKDIMQSFGSPEIFYTLAIQAFLSFLRKSNPERLNAQFAQFGISMPSIQEVALTNKKWLGAAEKLVYETLRECAPHLSPFSIHNPDGWTYWMVHFVKSHRGREAFNNVLHSNSTSQAHYGRSGLRMLAYNPDEEQRLFLFDNAGRQQSINELHSDIPDLVAKNGDSMLISEFFDQVYSQTPAHGEDIRKVIIENNDLEVITPNRGSRQKPNQIRSDDVIRLKAQHSFWRILRP